MRTLFVLEDLSALVKSGRLNKVSGIVASILSLCPVLGADGHGEIKMVAKARGMQNALRRLTEIVGQETAGAPPRSVTMVLAHCQAEERAESLKMQLKASCPAIGKVLVVPTVSCPPCMWATAVLWWPFDAFRGFSDNLHRFFRFACYSKSISMRRGG